MLDMEFAGFDVQRYLRDSLALTNGGMYELCFVDLILCQICSIPLRLLQIKNKVVVIIRIKVIGLSQRFWKNEVRRKEGRVE